MQSPDKQKTPGPSLCCVVLFSPVWAGGHSKYSCAEPQPPRTRFMGLGRVKRPRKGCCWKLKMLHLLGTLWVSYRKENHFSWDLLGEPPGSSRCSETENSLDVWENQRGEYQRVPEDACCMFSSLYRP